eukprot:8243293-Lingulodinium_polyedra.AAC.1
MKRPAAAKTINKIRSSAYHAAEVQYKKKMKDMGKPIDTAKMRKAARLAGQKAVEEELNNSSKDKTEAFKKPSKEKVES